MCTIAGCRTQPIAKGLCAKHYMRQRRTGDPNQIGKAGRPRAPLTDYSVKSVKAAGQPKPADDGAPLKARIRELEAENERLRARQSAPTAADADLSAQL